MKLRIFGHDLYQIYISAGGESVFGLGKKRSKLGKWLDDRGISQQWLSKDSKVSRSTVSELCKYEPEHEPTQGTIKKLMNSLRKVDPSAKVDDFFDM